jgi:hypothetical protein
LSAAAGAVAHELLLETLAAAAAAVQDSCSQEK